MWPAGRAADERCDTTKKSKDREHTMSYDNMRFQRTMEARARARARVGLGIVTGAIWLAAGGSVMAQQQTIPDGMCMQDRAGFNLNCTANDVSVAGVARLSNGAYDITTTDPCRSVGDSVTFTARFDVVLTAQERHDIGIYFANDGDPNNDGALTGRCSVSTLEWRPAYGGVDLDGVNDPIPGTKKPSGTQDTCGDINAAASPLKPLITVTAVCTDDDQDGFLDLPNCVSWRQSGANELCTGPADTFPGAPSKCKCDAGFDVPVPVPADVTLEKTVKKSTDTEYADSTSIDEPGGQVDYKVVVTVGGNDRTPDVTLNTLTDDIYGNIADGSNTNLQSTTCSLPQTLDGNGGSYTCYFSVNITGEDGNPAPDKSKNIVDTVTASAVDDVGNVFTPEDTATVYVLDVEPDISVTKTTTTSECLESALPCDFVFDVTITNNSVSSDPFTIDSLTDDPYGSITAVGGDVIATNCVSGQTIASGSTYSCRFTIRDSVGNAGDTTVDIVTAVGKDDEGNQDSASASATVSIVDVPSLISLTKTPDDDSIDEPGANVVYTLVFTNESTADSFDLTSLMDDGFGDVTEVGGAISATTCAVPQLGIAPGGSYSCSFTAYVAGNAGDAHINVVTASGTDDDGNQKSTPATATVNFNDLPPAALLSKSVTAMAVTYQVIVTSDSEAEDLYLSSLEDDQFGNIADSNNPKLVSTTCSVPQTLAAPSGSYTCSFTAIVTTSPHVNTVTGTVDDDDLDSDPVQPYDSAEVTFGDPAPTP